MCSSDLNFEVIDRDNQTGDSRWALSSRHKQTLSQGLTLSSNVNAASDDDYARDFPFSRVWAYQPGIPRRLLIRDVRLDYGAQEWTASGRLTEYQVLQDRNGRALIQRPYSRLPQLNYNYYGENDSGLNWSLGSEFTRFHQNFIPVDGDRKSTR